MTGCAFVDLDNTLVFSRRALERWDVPGKTEYIGVDRVDQMECGFVSLRTATLLADLVKRFPLVPATARSREQYARMTLFEDMPAVAIVANGALILRAGVMDEVWAEYLAKAIGEQCGTLSQAIAAFGSGHDIHVREDRLVVMSAASDAAAQAAATKVEPALRHLNWTVKIDRVRVYAYPAVMSKAAAAKWILGSFQVDIVVAAGDSALDKSLLELADQSIVPSHGSVAEDALCSSKIRVTEAKGTAAAEEVCAWILTMTAGSQSNEVTTEGRIHN